jgi:hypothetical protein
VPEYKTFSKQKKIRKRKKKRAIGVYTLHNKMDLN